MGKYIQKRLMGLIIVLIGITFFSFMISNISPVDPAEAFLRRSIQNVSEKQIQELREEMGLDLPIYRQYLKWISNALCGDFGESLVSKKPVIEEIAKRFPATLILVGAALLMIVIITVPIGVLCAVYKDSIFDNLIRVITILGISIPNFWLGFMLLFLFGVWLKLVPIVGYGSMKNVILPSATLAVAIAASSIRLLRSNILENMNKDYVIYARARGISKRKIIWKHILINAMSPMVTLFGQTIGYMIAGTAIVESVFSWPGIGRYAVDAIFARDLPVINAYVLIMAAIFVICNSLADIVNARLNPQMIKESGDL